ncbi:MAG: hypothetical protein ACLSEY_14820 [Enterocloster sp.]
MEAWLPQNAFTKSPSIFEVPMDEGMVVPGDSPAEKQPVQFAGGEFIRIGTNKKNLKRSQTKKENYGEYLILHYMNFELRWEI